MTHPIIKTDNYLVITSNEKIKLGDYLYYKHFDGDVIAKVTETADLENINNPDRFFKKIIAHLPINPWPEFAPPENLEGVLLLPPFEEYDFAEMFYNLLKATYPDFDEWVEAKEYKKYKNISQPKVPVGFKLLYDLIKNEDGKFLVPKIINGVMQGEWIFE